MYISVAPPFWLTAIHSNGIISVSLNKKCVDGGVNLKGNLVIDFAVITSLNTIHFAIRHGNFDGHNHTVKVIEEDTREKFRIQNLSLPKSGNKGCVTLAGELDLTKRYAVSIDGSAAKIAVPTGVFDTKDFVDRYCYHGSDLGAMLRDDGAADFKLWAPTATSVVLNLFTSGHEGKAYAQFLMEKQDKGVWHRNVPHCGHGVYYTYDVTVYGQTQEAVDPYAKACGVNGNRGMVVDMKATDPEGWVESKPVGLESYTKANIWEVHVRDFSNQVEDARYPGKYLAFTERGWKNRSGMSIGVDYLLDLGVTHIHLQPVNDYATVDEATSKGFNWGYDPQNYNCLEGSFSSDPFNGAVRIREFKQMVQSLHRDGLGVVVDVVYNHTFSSNSNLNKVVPYYYYRYQPNGKNTDVTGCGNDTASERDMFRKYMVDSVRFWVKEYKLDGVRFDLMGLHDVQTMQEVEAAVHRIHPQALLYGEGWDMAGNTTHVPMMIQSNAKLVKPSYGGIGGISVFNDAMRDGLKGVVFDGKRKGYIGGNLDECAHLVKFSISGGEIDGTNWRTEDGAVVNYMSCHDNHTLFDKLALSNKENTFRERLAMYRLGITIVMISKGTPFFLAGEEMLRDKNGVENSYNAPDEVNNIKWEKLKPGADAHEMMLFYKGLMQMRKDYDIFTEENGVKIEFFDLSGGGMMAYFHHTDGRQALALINPTEKADFCHLKSQWKLVCDGVHAGSRVLKTMTGHVTIPARTAFVLVK